jgi:hypothetical protein
LINYLINKRSDQFDEGDDDAGAEDNENEDDEEVKPKKEAVKKPTRAQNQKSKLAVAVAGEKNNASILSFFAKAGQPQKRAANATQGEILSNFWANRKLKVCKAI